MKTTGLAAAFAGIAVLASGTATADDTCDRECLRSTMTTFLYALLEHDAAQIPAAAAVRVTEDGIEKPLERLTLLNTVTRLRGYRQDILDERAGMLRHRRENLLVDGPCLGESAGGFVPKSERERLAHRHSIGLS